MSDEINQPPNMKQFEGDPPPLAPGTEHVTVFELPRAEPELREMLEQMKRAGAIKSGRLDLVQPGARFVLLGLKDDRRTLGYASLATEDELLHAIEWLYDRAVKQKRTSLRYDYAVAPAVLEKLRALEAELPKRYPGAPRIN
jgi:hypothetical protein